eukprot:1139915-Pelagomonas_calceolata.AAC.1
MPHPHASPIWRRGTYLPNSSGPMSTSPVPAQSLHAGVTSGSVTRPKVYVSSRYGSVRISNSGVKECEQAA